MNESTVNVLMHNYSRGTGGVNIPAEPTHYICEKQNSSLITHLSTQIRPKN